MSRIVSVKAREILDSRGSPTVEVELRTEDGLFLAAVPSGASVGKNEALELRDGGKRYLGKGVLKAVDNVNKIISRKIVGMDCTAQKEVDQSMITLDGTENKSRLGANAILGVSMACARAGAASKKMPFFEYVGLLFGNKSPNVLPVPQLNVMNGGKHAGLEHDIQEQMLVPVGARSFREALRISVESYCVLKSILKKRFGARGALLADEGGFVPPLKTVEERLEVMQRAVEEAGYEKEIAFALDCASSEFYEKKRYAIGKKKLSSEKLVGYYRSLTKRFKIISIEDGMAEEDWLGWRLLSRELGEKIQLVGDDLLVTDKKRIARAASEKACNALLLKLNQIGTVTEAAEAARAAFKSRWNVIVSHRSGETEDAFIADFVVGIGSQECKFGAPARSERNAKYNQLLRIEEALGRRARFAKPFK